MLREQPISKENTAYNRGMIHHATGTAVECPRKIITANGAHGSSRAETADRRWQHGQNSCELLRTAELRSSTRTASTNSTDSESTIANWDGYAGVLKDCSNTIFFDLTDIGQVRSE
jgi:hypothetical protein